jgi:hypothetical protein
MTSLTHQFERSHEKWDPHQRRKQMGKKDKEESGMAVDGLSNSTFRSFPEDGVV